MGVYVAQLSTDKQFLPKAGFIIGGLMTGKPLERPPSINSMPVFDKPVGEGLYLEQEKQSGDCDRGNSQPQMFSSNSVPTEKCGSN